MSHTLSTFGRACPVTQERPVASPSLSSAVMAELCSTLRICHLPYSIWPARTLSCIGCWMSFRRILQGSRNGSPEVVPKA